LSGRDVTEAIQWIEEKEAQVTRLEQVYFFHGEKQVLGPINFEAGEALETELELGRDDRMRLEARYSTHRGLEARSVLEIALPRERAWPVILNPDYSEKIQTEEKAAGKLITSTDLDVVLPSGWSRFRIFGKTHEISPAGSKRRRFALRSSMEDASQVEMSSDGNTWRPFDSRAIANGGWTIRFRIVRKYPKGALLVLGGLGARQYSLRYSEGEWKQRRAHKYRENLVPLALFPEAGSEEFFFLRVSRNDTVFILARDHPKGKRVDVVFEKPRVFSPVEFSLERVQG